MTFQDPSPEVHALGFSSNKEAADHGKWLEKTGTPEFRAWLNGIKEAESEPLTFKLTNGAQALARIVDGEPWPYHFANITQAERKRAEMGDGWAVRRFTGRPFYVVRVQELP